MRIAKKWILFGVTALMAWSQAAWAKQQCYSNMDFLCAAPNGDGYIYCSGPYSSPEEAFQVYLEGRAQGVAVYQPPMDKMCALYSLLKREYKLVQGQGSELIGFPEEGLGEKVPLTNWTKNDWLVIKYMTYAQCSNGQYVGVGKTIETMDDGVVFNCSQIPKPDVVLGLFNGVGNTEKMAQQSKERLEGEFGNTYKETPLKYELFYNQTACGSAWYGKLSCLEDVAEVFEQRSKELDGVFANRWEVFWDILAGRHRAEGSLSHRLVSLLGDGGNALLQWLDSTANAAINQLAAAVLKLLTLFTQSPQYENRAQHLAQLQAHADRGAGLVLVAHSQGNLFVNSAYDALLAAKPDAEARVVHIAPASPTLRGEHLLADIDLVINGLRTTGINTVAPANIVMPTSSRDLSGHGFEPTYLDKARNAYARTLELINNSLQALVP